MENNQEQKSNETQEQKNTQGTKTPKKVKLIVPLEGLKGDPNLLICINGKNWVIPRGVEVEVPAFVAEEYKRAEAAKRFMNEQQRQKIEKAMKSDLA